MSDESDEDYPPETPREAFLRNHQENNGMMRAAVRRMRTNGSHELADICQEMIEVWEDVATNYRNGIGL